MTRPPTARLLQCQACWLGGVEVLSFDQRLLVASDQEGKQSDKKRKRNVAGQKTE
jgi:hypothetical protein